MDLLNFDSFKLMKLLNPSIKTPTLLSLRKQPTLREYHDNRNKVLINREIGGLGDILMHRMMFEDFKKEGIELHFACPKLYHSAVQDHPFLDQVLDCAEVDPYSYKAVYNTTTVCGRYEMSIAPKSDLHRSDIWAKHCGFELTNHNMHLILSDQEKEFGKQTLEKISNKKPTVAFCPIAAQSSKNLTGLQITGVLDGLSQFGVAPFGLHSKPIMEIEKTKIPMISGLDIRQWMGVINATDYVISVDTSSFHLAGGLGKPLVGIFGWTNGNVYGKHFSKIEIVQGSCPLGYLGCYNWCKCPLSDLNRKPCITSITSKDILDAFEKLITQYN